MKLIITTIRELSINNIDILPHEPLDTDVIITNDGYCFIKGNHQIAQKLNAATTDNIMNMFDNYVLIPYIKAITDTTLIDMYYTNSTFMSRIYQFLLNNNYFSMTTLAEAIDIDKKICKQLLSKLKYDGMITAYNTYWKVTSDNTLRICDALQQSLRSQENNVEENSSSYINVDKEQIVKTSSQDMISKEIENFNEMFGVNNQDDTLTPEDKLTDIWSNSDKN